MQARKIVGVHDVIPRDTADMPEAQVREESVPFKEICHVDGPLRGHHPDGR